MKEYAPDKIRNVALVGHQDTGKTLLAEAILFNTGVINRMGKIEDGSTAMDTAAEEVERQISIQASLAFCEHEGHKINLIDTPGYEDFVGEVISALDVVEGAVLVVRGDGGVEVGTNKIAGYLAEKKMPAVICINKMDKENASFNKCIEELKETMTGRVLPMALPIGEGNDFKGVVSLLRETAYEYPADGSGEAKEIDIPADMADAVAAASKEVFETAAEQSEELMEKYLETETLTREEALQGLLVGMEAGDVFPVFCTSAERNIGIDRLLAGIIGTVPAPTTHARKIEDGELKADPKLPIAAKIFKNVSESHVGDMLFLRVFQGTLEAGKDVYNSTRDSADRLGALFCLQGKGRVDAGKLVAGDIGAAVKLKHAHVGDTLCEKSNQLKIPATQYPSPSIFSAIEAASKGDEDKISAGLSRLKEEDPTFEVRVDGEVHQTLISGQGEMHLDILIGRLKKRYGVDVILSKPRIPYKETIRKSASAQGKYKKQTGGRGQYGDVHLKLEPMPRGEDFEFVDAIVGGVVPGKFIPAVEKGVKETMTRGVLAGYQVVDVKATLFDGSYHNVDSSEQAFKMAASMAFKKAAADAKMVLLEPIMDIEVRVPEEFMGDVMGDLSGRRGKIQGTESQGRMLVVKAQVPQAELYRYSTHLRSMTQGRGTHSRVFSHYEEVPVDAAAKVIEEYQKQKAEENA